MSGPASPYATTARQRPRSGVGEPAVRLALVPPAEQQNERPVERRHRHLGRGDVGALRVVDPENPVDLAHRLHPVRDRPEGPEPGGHAPGIAAGPHRHERGREGVGDVVVAEQRQLGARASTDSSPSMSRPAVPVVPAVGPPQDREPEVGALALPPPWPAPRHRPRCSPRPIRARRSGTASPCRRSTPRASAYRSRWLGARLVSTPMAGRRWGTSWSWNELELEREPVRRVRRERDVAERPADVARRLGPQASRRHERAR